jgi:hypothetical protein
MPKLELNDLTLEWGADPATVEILHEAGGALRINLMRRDGGMGNRIEVAAEGDAVVLRVWAQEHWAADQTRQRLTVLRLEPREREESAQATVPATEFELYISLGVIESDTEAEAARARADAQTQWQRLREGISQIPVSVALDTDVDGLEFLNWRGVLPAAEAILYGTRIATGAHINVMVRSRRVGDVPWLDGAPWSREPLCRVWLNVRGPSPSVLAQLAEARPRLAELTAGLPGLPASAWGRGPNGEVGVVVEFDALLSDVERVAGRIVETGLADSVQMAMQYFGDGRDRPTSPWLMVACDGSTPLPGRPPAVPERRGRAADGQQARLL